MNRESTIFGILGLLIGIVLGFTAANQLNRNQLTPSTKNETVAPANPNLPANHPPLFTSGGQKEESQPLPPQVNAAIEKALQEPNNYEAQMTAADLYYQMQKFREAATFYEKANKIRPDEPEPMAKLGNSFFDIEEFEKAEIWYEKALKKTPNDLILRTDYSLTFFLRIPRDADRAIAEQKITLSIDPNHELTLQNLAAAYNAKKDKKNLEDVLIKLRKINPDNPAIREFGRNVNTPSKQIP